MSATTAAARAFLSIRDAGASFRRNLTALGAFLTPPPRFAEHDDPCREQALDAAYALGEEADGARDTAAWLLATADVPCICTPSPTA